MVWIWNYPRETQDFGSVFYGFDPDPQVKGLAEFSAEKITVSTRAIFKSRYSLKRFKALHAPPTSTIIAVDGIWREILRSYVSDNQIQFIPAHIIARGETCDDYSVMIPFDRVVGIDKQNSEIRRMIENERGVHIFSIKKLVLKQNCLGSLHLARDVQMSSLLLVSDELKEALSATGQDSCFYSIDEYNKEFTWL